MAVGIEQREWRWRNNDGDESSATYAAAARTSITINPGVKIRLHVVCREILGVGGSHPTGLIQYSLNGGTYTDVGAATDCAFAASLVPGYGHGDDSVSGSAIGTGTFQTDNDAVVNNAGTSASKNQNASEEKEYEFCLVFLTLGSYTFQFKDSIVIWTTAIGFESPAITVACVPGKLSLTLTTFAPTVTATTNVRAVPSTAALSLTAFAPSARAPRLCTPGALSLTTSVFAPSVLLSDNKRAVPGVLALSLMAFAPNVSPKVIEPVGVASAAMLGLPNGKLLAIGVSALASAAMLGEPDVLGPVYPEGALNTQSFGLSTVQLATGDQPVEASGFANPQAYGGADVTVGAIVMLPDGLLSGEWVGSPSLAHLLLPASVNLPGPSSRAQIGRPSVMTRIVPVGRPSTAAVGVPHAGHAVAPVGLAAASSCGAPDVSVGSVAVVVGGVPNTNALGAPVVGAQAVAVAGIAGASAPGSPQAIAKVQASALASTGAYGQPGVAEPGTPTIAPLGFSATAIGLPQIAAAVAVGGTAGTAALGEPGVAVGSVSASPGGVASTAQQGLPDVSLRQGVEAVAVGSTASVGAPAASGRPFLVVASVASTAALGQPGVQQRPVVACASFTNSQGFGEPAVGVQTARPVGAAATSAPGRPSVARGAVAVAPLGLGAAAATGLPSVVPKDFDQSLTVTRTAPVEPRESRTAPIR